MLRARPEPPAQEETSLSTSTAVLLWTAFVLDLAAVVLTTRMSGEPGTSLLLSTLTLGGHPRIVLGLALAGALLLAVLAPLTDGFVRANRVQRVLLPVAGVLSLSALSGALFVVGLVVGAVALAALLFRPYPRTLVDVRRRGF
jgi:hypothetical protein